MDGIKRLIRSITFPVYRPLMRLWRGQTLGVRCIVLDSERRVLLVRHSYVPGWSFPGGGVERRETVYEALARETREEAGVVFDAPPRLHGIFAAFHVFPGDHVAVFIAEKWHATEASASRLEITDAHYFPLDDLPANITRGTRQRLKEAFLGEPLSENW